ncbi:MAG TPA: hypothetical protein VFU05_09760 [Cyclobacteriaceae bacterium]|nr:hypothetical protein [Cyclobacteriaceae bacterium]
MKKSMLMAIALTTTLSAFSNDEKIKSADHMAQELISSLKQSSSVAFVELLPTLSDFYLIMDGNAHVYGPHLKEAKEEFASVYTQSIIPNAKKSFESLLADGKEHGINWKNVNFLRLEEIQGSAEGSIASFDIVVSLDNKAFKIRVKNALQVNGQWKVSQFVKLI